MADDDRSPASTDDAHGKAASVDKKPAVPMRKSDGQRDASSLYVEPSARCYIGQGNNAEL
jgi:hypothetical protein